MGWGAGWKPARAAISCALRRATAPGLAAGANYLKAGARAGDRLRQQLKGSHSPHHHRARAAAGVPHRTATTCRTATMCRSCTASPGQPSSTRWSTPRARSAPRRISSKSRRGSRMRLKALAAGLWPGACQTAGPNTPALARATRRRVGYQFVSSVSPSLCSTFFSRVSP